MPRQEKVFQTQKKKSSHSKKTHQSLPPSGRTSPQFPLDATPPHISYPIDMIERRGNRRGDNWSPRSTYRGRYSTDGRSHFYRSRDVNDGRNRDDRLTIPDDSRSTRGSDNGFASGSRKRKHDEDPRTSSNSWSMRSSHRSSEDERDNDSCYRYRSGIHQRSGGYESISDDGDDFIPLTPISRASSVSSLHSLDSDDHFYGQTPRTCTYYNAKGCNKHYQCPFLHICKYFVTGNCKFDRRCDRSHDLTDNQPYSLLKRYRLDHHVGGNDENVLQWIAAAEQGKSKVEWKMKRRGDEICEKLFPEDELLLERKFQQYLKAKKSIISIDNQKIKVDFSKMKGRSSRNAVFQFHRSFKTGTELIGGRLVYT